MRDARQVIAYLFAIGLAANLAILYSKLVHPWVDVAAFGGTFLKVITIYSAPLGIVLAKIFSRSAQNVPLDSQSILAIVLVIAWNIGVVLVVYFETTQLNLDPAKINYALDVLTASISFLTAALLGYYFDLKGAEIT